MRILLISLLMIQMAYAEALVSDQEANTLMNNYQKMFEEKEGKLVDEVFTADYFGDKSEKEAFLKNLKLDKSKPEKLTWKTEKSNSEGKYLRVKDKIFVIVKTPKGPRLQHIFEAQ